jgi:hypothetical protein
VPSRPARRKLHSVAPQTRTDRRPYPLIAAGHVVLAVAVIAPVAVGAGVAAVRVFDAGHPFAVTLVATIACGLLSGLLAAPDLRRRIEQATPRLPAAE